MALRIENAPYARSGILFGRVLPVLIAACAVWTLVSLISNGPSRGTAVPIILMVVWIAAMAIAFVRRGRHRAVYSLEFLPDRMQVQFGDGTESFDLSQIRSLQYEGVHNRSRAAVRVAPFPPGGERVLVVTLVNGKELRAKVSEEHDAELKRIAMQIQPPKPT
ncbi:MAG: hypothetical protein K8T25_08100 [Planctomycetia bacterium]|nr:hypothetical protein [Planctomycetia bacterium]